MEGAALAIKSYSPEIIVHPCGNNVERNRERISKWMPSLHGFVVGPGMGKGDIMMDMGKFVIEQAIKLNKILVVDADGINIICQNPAILKGYRKIILTPNFNEYRRLCDAYGLTNTATVSELARALGGVTIVQKGKEDLISNGHSNLVCNQRGSFRRCGGQGDLTSGSIATFLTWFDLFKPKTLKYPGEMVAAYAGCLLTRRCNYTVYQEKGRSTQTSDMIESIGKVFAVHFENS
eukprot:TRINITY_DN9452_c0_g1_i1.p1 TRINITY_DN9452_c0_g1~~TRINITY_DN9452_c0_g1_i1.p1  ORF type:complete len:275 (+),score=19.13 TRINITY_DN9452_c0_g1_i1:122-826(+)